MKVRDPRSMPLINLKLGSFCSWEYDILNERLTEN